MAKRDKSIEELDRELAALEAELAALQSGSSKSKKPRDEPAPAEPAPSKKSLLGRFGRKGDDAPKLASVAEAAADAAEAPSGSPPAGAYRWEREGRLSRRLRTAGVEPERIVRVVDADGRVVSESAASPPAAAPRLAALGSRVPSLFRRKRTGGEDG